MKKTCSAAFVLFIQALQCLASDDLPFQLTNSVAGYCLVKTNNDCTDIRWTTGDRLLVQQRNKCLGAQGKSVGSEISLYDCDETSELQKWECMNETVLALKDQELYIELTADNTAVLSKTVGPNNHLTITGTSNGACTRTYRELYTTGGNAAGQPCMFPFQYRDQWYSNCTTVDSSEKRLWCAVETKYQNERWGYCPVTTKEDWHIHPTTGAYYQLNTQSALTWRQAETSCKQQGASLLSITDPQEQAYVIALLGTGDNELWTGLILDPEHGWKWSNGRPYRYLRWVSGHPLPDPEHSCAIFDPAVQYSWKSSPCTKKVGYICYSQTSVQLPTQTVETGFCLRPWIAYNRHCFRLDRTKKTWSDAQRECRNGAGNLATIRDVEDQSFVISQLGYESTDELWIGLNDRKTEGLFDWTDRSTVSFTSWEFGKPATSTEMQDCVVIRGENGNWADRVCEEKHGFICRKMSALKPTGDEEHQDKGCKTGWRRRGSHCYFIATQSKTFSAAGDDCKSSDSHLADVSNGMDNAFIISLVGRREEKHFWLGLSNQRNIDQFVWTDKDTVAYTHWNADMPGRRQGCVAMITGISAGVWDVLPCNNTEKYICKHLAEGAVPTPPPPTSAPQCAPYWTPLPSRNYCYKTIFSKKSWFEARDYCRAIGGDLLSIHSAEDLKSVNGYGEVWIGLHAPDPVTNYVWSDGSPLQFQHWKYGEPNNKNNAESCVEFEIHWKNSQGSWSDLHCEKPNGFACQIPAGVTPKPSPSPSSPDYNRTSDGWLEWNGNQYYFIGQKCEMGRARRYCQQMRSDLVTINSEAESIFLWKQMYHAVPSYWIGLTVDQNRTYGWMDGSPAVFQRWEENQPRFSNEDEKCAVMTSSMGFWRVNHCAFMRQSICKRSVSPLASVTVAPTVSPKGGCPQNWKKYDSKCYKVVHNQNETWERARTKCRAMGGNLASILSHNVQVFLIVAMAEAPTTDLWIGLSIRNSDVFYWTDGQPKEYNNWGYKMVDDSIRFRYRSFNEVDMYRLFNNKRQCVTMTTDPLIGIGKWTLRPCNDTAGFVCLRNVDPSLPDSTEPVTYSAYVRILNDSVKVVTQPMTWDAARKHCEDDGAHLVSLRNEWSEAYVELTAMTLGAPLWIGLNRNMTGGYFRYIAGWRLTVTNWDANDPMMKSHCVYVDVDRKWKTADCNENKNSICMKTTDAPPTESPLFPGFCPGDPEFSYNGRRQGWLTFKGYCYLFFTSRLYWLDSLENCVLYGATLVSIEDPSEKDFIEENMRMYQDSQSSFWIGLYQTPKGKWQWLDRMTMNYSNWDLSHPGSGTYAAIDTKSGRWTSEYGWYQKSFICKTPKVLMPLPPVAANRVMDPQTRGHIILAGVLVPLAILIGTVITFFVLKKTGRCLHIPITSTSHDNPTFFNNEQFEIDVLNQDEVASDVMEEKAGPVDSM